MPKKNTGILCKQNLRVNGNYIHSVYIFLNDNFLMNINFIFYEMY